MTKIIINVKFNEVQAVYSDKDDVLIVVNDYDCAEPEDGFADVSGMFQVYCKEQ